MKQMLAYGLSVANLKKRNWERIRTLC
jgi:hypothetical protein